MNARHEAIEQQVREEDKTKLERDTAALAQTPEIAQLAAETKFSSEYLASLQMTMKESVETLTSLFSCTC